MSQSKTTLVLSLPCWKCPMTCSLLFQSADCVPVLLYLIHRSVLSSIWLDGLQRGVDGTAVTRFTSYLSSRSFSISVWTFLPVLKLVSPAESHRAPFSVPLCSLFTCFHLIESFCRRTSPSTYTLIIHSFMFYMISSPLFLDLNRKHHDIKERLIWACDL